MKFLPYIYDFLSILYENEKIKDYISRIILFGSVAIGEADEESDIDLFIDVRAEAFVKEVELIIKETEKRFYLISEKKWSLLGIKTPIKCIVGILEGDRWKDLRSEIIASGIMLYGKFEEKEGRLKHFSLINYSLSGLKQQRKMSLLRSLFGYSTKKAKKLYKKAGLLQETGGVKLTANTVLVPVENSRKIQKLLNSYGITPEIREIWTRE
jgi:predicted nucleotidyltransferase